MSERTAQSDEPLRCPKCDSKLFVEQLVMGDEGGSETVFFIDCPRGDFNITMTDKEVIKIMTDMVMERLRSNT